MIKNVEEKQILERVHANPAFRKFASSLEPEAMKQIEESVVSFLADFSRALAVGVVASNQK